jgi:hypothetical protein
MDVKLAVICDYANVSQDGKLNIMGVFHEITPPVLPYQVPRMFLVASFDAGPAEFGTDKHVRISLLENDGTQLLSLDGPVSVHSPSRVGSRAIINQVIGIEGFLLERSGDYAFHILVNDEEKTSAALHVNEVPEGQEGGSQ